MDIDWFKPRHYKHFDRGVGESFALKAMNPSFVMEHAFSPLIRYEKLTKRYKKKENKTVVKARPIMYASHRDSCILSFYASIINHHLNDFYQINNLSDAVIAYRSLGRSNYHFSAAAYNYALNTAPCGVLAFDVSGFFDNLNHKLLKERLKRLLAVRSLSEDWHRVLRFVTKFHFVELDKLKTHEAFAAALDRPGTNPIATVAELKKAGIDFQPNPSLEAGIPQGTPISAALSNLYMIDFDLAVLKMCESIGAMYRRYSDDIMVICPIDKMEEIENMIMQLMGAEKLELSADKTERTIFDPSDPSLSEKRSAQYLGFSYYLDGAGLRPSSLSRQWRKMRRNVRKIGKVAELSIAAGLADKVWTKKLRRRFSALQFRNFSSYARRAASAFGENEKILRQARRFERAFEKELQRMIQPKPQALTHEKSANGVDKESSS
ncbi:reverse transcriptase domain-containing protein [Nitrospirillum bahiense]|uniref:Reverse transcriptase (RNA-dependent DNA polymerase) n=1 Tax=Nitrospirillum amazonense TaxID=28077 RepID=A0A560FHR4_9PROT|nr:reverse transcriptase domain-containing protein [Nitrospirillum amazonense]TWB21126.1 reverse transcriptase (RNA-dependent DNA polymerase) [Nitrospirillum amazonense]